MAEIVDTTTGRSPKQRLSKLRVDEVSLVDRAANGRRYVIVKRAAGTTDGGRQMAGNAAGNQPIVKQDTTAGAAAAAAPATSASASADAASAGAAGASTGGASEAGAGSAAAPTTAADDISALRKQLADLHAEIKTLVVQPVAETAGAGAAAADQPVEKKGAKMAAARLEKLKAAHTQLADLLKELEPGDDDVESTPAKKNDSAGVDADVVAQAVAKVVKPLEEKLAKVAAIEAAVGKLEKLEGALGTVEKRLGEIEQTRGVTKGLGGDTPATGSGGEQRTNFWADSPLEDLG
jgi:hypothetical protein